MKTIALIVAATVMLAACAALELKPPVGPRVTAVMIDGEYIWIDQEPIIVRDKGVAVVWRIATSGYEFTPDSVVFDDPRGQRPFINCAAKGQVFQCESRSTGLGRFKYTIKVRSTGAAKTPEPLDPSVWIR